MRYLLLAALLLGCSSSQADNMRACKEACLPNGVKKYDDDSGCICNTCPGDKPQEMAELE